MLLDIKRYPDKILRTKSTSVSDFGLDLHRLLDNMYETMLASNGVGLAAIQVGIPIRAIVINLPRDDGIQYKDDLIEILNPVFVEKGGDILWSEGCLSVPGFYADIHRYDHLLVEYQDRFGEKVSLRATDFLAVAFQHECDHLDGVLFVDRLSILERKKFEKEFRKIAKAS